MTRIGLLSDTHAYWDEKYLEYFEPCDEIWHAGDIGSLEVAEKLAAFRPFRAVYGNIDGQEIRKLYPQINRFTVDGASFGAVEMRFTSLPISGVSFSAQTVATAVVYVYCAIIFTPAAISCLAALPSAS